jgi:hypothetical protein
LEATLTAAVHAEQVAEVVWKGREDFESDDDEAKKGREEEEWKKEKEDEKYRDGGARFGKLGRGQRLSWRFCCCCCRIIGESGVVNRAESGIMPDDTALRCNAR